jgi:hypothetical protein
MCTCLRSQASFDTEDCLVYSILGVAIVNSALAYQATPENIIGLGNACTRDTIIGLGSISQGFSTMLLEHVQALRQKILQLCLTSYFDTYEYERLDHGSEAN